MQKFKEQLSKLLPLIRRAMADASKKEEIESWALEFIPQLTSVCLPNHSIRLVQAQTSVEKCTQSEAVATTREQGTDKSTQVSVSYQKLL